MTITPGRSRGHSPELRAAARHIGRRRFLGLTTAAAALAFAVDLPATGTAAAAQLDAARIDDFPFTLGVASGEPLPGSVVLWTRLAPAPDQPDGGLPAERVDVDWEVAEDETFATVVARGTAVAHPEFHHTVHVEAEGLASGRVHYYRFRAGDWLSETGRTRTAPAADSPVSSLTLAAVSCQAYHDGYFTAHRHLAEDDVDLVLHLGDYLYEYAVDPFGGARAYTDRVLPSLFDHETGTLEDYRLRYALYKSDPDLRAAAPSPRTPSRRSSSCCAAPPPTAPTGRTSRYASPSCPSAPTCSSTDGSSGACSPSSTSSTPVSTAPTRCTRPPNTPAVPSRTTRRAPSPGRRRRAG
jgi:alkaline phosphatase D